MRSCAGVVVDTFVGKQGKYGRFPTWEVCLNYDCICQLFPENSNVAAALVNIFEAIDRQLPETYKVSFPELYAQMQAYQGSHTGPTLPLYEVVNVGKVLIEILYQFYNVLGDEGYEVRKQLQDNENALYNLTPYQRRTKGVPLPTQSDLAPRELAFAYLKNTPFVQLFNTPVPFEIPKKAWTSHGIVLAPSGHGKTQLLGSLIAGFLKDDDSPGLFVLDPHGDLYNILRQRVGGNRLVALNPDHHPPPLNFLDFGNSTDAATLQTFSYLMSSLSGGLSDKQGAIVPYLLKLLRRIPHASLETLRLIVDEKVKSPQQSQFAPAIATLPPTDQGFFHSTWFHSSMEQTKKAIAWKLYSALSSDAFRQMFGAKGSSLDFDQLIADRKVVVVKGGYDALGEDGMRIFLQFLVAQYYAAGMRRLRLPERERHLNVFICDEASHILTTPIVARMLFDLRKVGCGFLAATQVWEQVATDVKAAVLGNTAIKIVGPVQHSDASVLSREMYTSVDFIRGMQRSDSQLSAPWAMYVNGVTKTAARVNVPFLVLEHMEKINPEGRQDYEMPKQEGDTYEEVPPSQPVATGAHEADSTITNGYENTSLSQHDRDTLLLTNACIKFEAALKEKYGAKGGGFGERFQSVIDKIPEHLHDAASHFGRIRNRQIHEAGFELYSNTREKILEDIKLLEDFLLKDGPDEPMTSGKNW